ncbi:MAG TPA: hypothetical protein VKP30_26310 [Polyangiaceae bacterium]|nr:hypothetical protein [Polyangiaceae bacterium]
MTLQLEHHAALLASLQRGEDAPVAAVMDVVRHSYPEVFRTISLVLAKGQESVSIEPGDVVVVRPDTCVMHRDHLLRRRVFRREEENRDHDARTDRPGEPNEALEIWKDIDCPKNGIASIEWDRARYGVEPSAEERSGRVLISTFEALGTASKEVPLRQITDGIQREFVELFATRSLVPVINAFFGVRSFMLDVDMLLLTRADLHGTDRLQDLVRNPVNMDSEHMLHRYPEKHAETFQFFRRMRDVAFASPERRSEATLADLPRSQTLDILTAIAVPQIHGTISNLLRMQFAFVQPHSVIGAPLLNAGASLQPAWDVSLQLRLLDAASRQPSSVAVL